MNTLLLLRGTCRVEGYDEYKNHDVLLWSTREKTARAPRLLHRHKVVPI